jgi:hypothetical protein
MSIRTPSKNAKMLAPTIIILVSKIPSLAGVIMILKQSLDMDLQTVVKLEEQNATTSMTTFAKVVCSLLIIFKTCGMITLTPLPVEDVSMKKRRMIDEKEPIFTMRMK